MTKNSDLGKEQRELTRIWGTEMPHLPPDIREIIVAALKKVQKQKNNQADPGN